MRRFVAAKVSVVAIMTTERHNCFVRCYSEVRNTYDGVSSLKDNIWNINSTNNMPSAPSYPPSQSSFPLPVPALRKTNVEWKSHHGNSTRYGFFGPSREIADWEYADGTPPPISPTRYAFKHHQDHLLFQLIRSGAKVEELERNNQLPRVPGTAEQRDWDPEIPLFLNDLDERGSAPVPESAFGFTSPSESSSSPSLQNGMNGASSFIHDEQQRRAEKRFASLVQIDKTLTNKYNNETLEPNTMFASYDPAAFVSDRIEPDKRRPVWSRSRWSLSDDFLVKKNPRPTNTIPDE